MSRSVIWSLWYQAEAPRLKRRCRLSALLVTGAGSGIGRALVDRSVTRGDLTIAAVFSEHEAANMPRAAHLHIVQMDVGSSDSVTSAFAEIDRLLDRTPLRTVIHCAGICPLGALEAQAAQVLLDTLNVNTVGTARVLRASLPRLRRHGGRIALLTSLWGKVAGPMLSAYCASKFAIEAIVDTTRREIEGQGIDLVVVEPGVVRTALVAGQVDAAEHAVEGLPANLKPIYADLYRKYHSLIARNAGSGLSAEQAAERIEEGIFAKKPAFRIKIGKDAKAVTALARLLPDRALDAMFRKMLG